MSFSDFLETLRDRVVHRSQVGKRKLDRTKVRRKLDEANRVLGERFRALCQAGRIEVPQELGRYFDAVKSLEEQLQEIDRKLEALKNEHLKPQGSTT
ncbi:MAG: hypothetical protein QM704_23105 [Anaeromyxobacteraceae bacterium]